VTQRYALHFGGAGSFQIGDRLDDLCRRAPAEPCELLSGSRNFAAAIVQVHVTVPVDPNSARRGRASRQLRVGQVISGVRLTPRQLGSMIPHDVNSRRLDRHSSPRDAQHLTGLFRALTLDLGQTLDVRYSGTSPDKLAAPSRD
jgi:hypothetical protein